MRARLLPLAAFGLVFSLGTALLPAEGAPRPRVALVLSGGSALGIAHAGVIEVIEELGIPVDMVLGTSMGSIVGGLYAAGYSPAEMQELVRGLDWPILFSERRDDPAGRFRLLRDSRFPAHLAFDRSGLRFGEGLLQGQHILTLFTGLTLDVAGVEDFDRLPVPYRAVAADIVTGERVVFSKGSLAEAMRASMSIPGLFVPWDDGRHLLVDGGIVDNMPVDLARELGADIVIAVESRVRTAASPAELRSGFSISAQTLELFVEENMRASRKEADLLIRPELSGLNPASFAAAAELIDRGRGAALALRPELEALAARIAASRPLVRPEEEPNRAARRRPPLLGGLRYEGGSPEDRAAAAAAFMGLEGRDLEASSLEGALERTWATGRFSLVTIDFSPLPASPGGGSFAVEGRVSLTDPPPPRHEVLLGGSWRGVFSPLGSLDSRLSPALYLAEPSGKGSALFVAAELLGRSGARAEWFQPFGPFYLRGGLEWASRWDTWTAGEGLAVRSYYREATASLGLGLALGRRGELEAVWSLASVRATLPDDPSQGLGVQSSLVDYRLGSLGADFEWSDLDREPFPSRGLSFDLEGNLSDPRWGGDRSYASLELSASAALPLGRSWSISGSIFGGSDLLGLGDGLVHLPSPSWFSLARPGIFPLLETRSARGLGNQALAASLELRQRAGRLNALFGGDIYLIGNLSAGSTRLEGRPEVDFLPLRWSAAFGVGLRFVERLGALALVGLVADGDPLAPLRPALTLRLGNLDDSY